MNDIFVVEGNNIETKRFSRLEESVHHLHKLMYENITSNVVIRHVDKVLFVLDNITTANINPILYTPVCILNDEDIVEYKICAQCCSWIPSKGWTNKIIENPRYFELLDNRFKLDSRDNNIMIELGELKEIIKDNIVDFVKFVLSSPIYISNGMFVEIEKFEHFNSDKLSETEKIKIYEFIENVYSVKYFYFSEIDTSLDGYTLYLNFISGPIKLLNICNKYKIDYIEYFKRKEI